jgi:excisionase family DNA binding protein
MGDDRLLTTEEVLDRLQLNIRTVYRLIKAGKLPAVRVGRQWRFRSRDVEAWVAKGGAVAEDATEPRTPHMFRILVVDDDDSVLRAMMAYLVRGGYRVDGAQGGTPAVERLTTTTYDLLVTDLMMPGMNGLALVRRAREIQPGLPVVVVTGHSTEAMAIEALNLGVSAYLKKPVRSAPLLSAVAKAVGAVETPPQEQTTGPKIFQPE